MKEKIIAQPTWWEYLFYKSEAKSTRCPKWELLFASCLSEGHFMSSVITDSY